MVDDGYLVGYEDTNGNFVEVGRFNNTSENVSDPLVIQHADSGETMELGPNGFSTNSISTEALDISNLSGAGSTDAILSALDSANAGLELRRQRTDGVSTSGKSIFSLNADMGGAVVCVIGDETNSSGGGEEFFDVVAIGRGITANRINSMARGGAASRTYSQTGGVNLNLVMGSGSYEVSAAGLVARRVLE